MFAPSSSSISRMDEVWSWFGQQAGNILGVLSLITGFTFYLLSRKPRQFAWYVLSSSPIGRHAEGRPQLTGGHDAKDVANPNRVIVRVGNVGKAAIGAHDFDGPARIKFNCARLLEASVSESSSPDLTLELDQRDNSVFFTPSLLNAEEWVDIQLITDGPVEEPQIFARVSGQSGPMFDSWERRSERWEPLLGWSYIGFFVLVAIGFFFFQEHELVMINVGTFYCLIMFALYILVIWRPRWVVKLENRRPYKDRAALDE